MWFTETELPSSAVKRLLRPGRLLLFLSLVSCAGVSPDRSDSERADPDGPIDGRVAWGVTICGSGKVNVDGHCCWPGQTWQDEACAGMPTCPVDFKLSGDECEPDCQHQQIITGGRCCWPGQEWSEKQAACQGAPDCPDGTAVEGTGCVPDPDVAQAGSGLVWLRCPMGQTWTGQACSGQSKQVTWKEAQTLCPAGYRLPAVQELAALLGGCEPAVQNGKPGTCASCERSEACAALFRRDMDCYWADAAHGAEYAWNALFELGRIGVNRKVSPAAVRCVKE